MLKVQNGGDTEREKKGLPKKGDGNTALGILLLLLAWMIYPSSLPIALGAALLGVYLIFGGR